MQHRKSHVIPALICAVVLVVVPAAQSTAQTSTASDRRADSIEAEVAKDSLIKQRVDSPKGYVAGVPESARLDSSRSGWNPVEKYEQRVYVIDGAGEISFTVHIADSVAPEGSIKTSAYTYTHFEDTTDQGVAYTRTYYLPTRRVQIKLVPYGIGMHPYAKERERILNSFRWKPGADTDKINVDRATAPPNVEMKSGFDQNP